MKEELLVKFDKAIDDALDCLLESNLGYIDFMVKFENEMIVKAVKRHENSVMLAAKAMRLNRTTVYSKFARVKK